MTLQRLLGAQHDALIDYEAKASSPTGPCTASSAELDLEESRIEIWRNRGASLARTRAGYRFGEPQLMDALRRAGRAHTCTVVTMLRCMRTTIEFDPDVAAELARRRAEGRGTLRDDVNQLVRLGLAREREQATSPGERFSTPTFDSGRPLVSIDDVEAAIAYAEGEDHH